MNHSEFLWTEKYRPKTIEDCILPEELKQIFQKFVDDKSVPNLLLAGRSGVGKTTVARTMLEQLGCDYIVINGSLNGNIDTLRNDIQSFASSVSFQGGRKYVILDEADYLNANSTQPALRNFMEEYAKNCGFILTCNYKNRILEPLHSRCSVIEFKIPTDEKQTLAAQFFKRVCGILETESVPFDKSAVAALVTRHFPDWRRVLNELQKYSATGKIDTGILASLSDVSFKQLTTAIANKKYAEVRKWVAENADIEPSVLFRRFYDSAAEIFKPESIPQVVVILAEYQYKAAFVADQEINTMAAFTEIMVDSEFV